jgi:type VI protein secretion system component VasF
MSGLRAELNTIDPSGQGMAREARPSLTDRSFWWLLPVVVLAFVAALLGYARRVHSRRNGNG